MKSGRLTLASHAQRRLVLGLISGLQLALGAAEFLEFNPLSMLNVQSYTPEVAPAWDDLVRTARNGVFLFERGYMDYHADRFEDASLVVLDEGEPVALLPAHRIGTDWVAHGGLTFGGLVLHTALGAQAVLHAFDVLTAALRSRGATRLVYKPVPHIYHRQPAEDDVYALHRLGARTVRVDLSTTVDLERRPPLSKGRRHALSKASRAGVTVRATGDFAGYWALMSAVLAERHGVAPTHHLDEITRLAARFPQIRCYGAHATDGELLAGAVVYRYDGVLHTQYMASSSAGREVGALDAVIAHLLDHASEGCRWLNFGVSTVDQGRQLNAGLAAQKEMFGGRSTLLQTLELDLTALPS